MDEPKDSTPDQSKKKKKKELVVVPHPAEEEDIAEEMSDLFEEETVKHQHGRTEPERD